MKDIIYRGDGCNNIKRYPNCHMRTSLGNCDAIGGFCTSINAPICDAFHKLVDATQDWIPISKGLPEEHEWVGTKEFGTTISDKVHITFDVNGERFVKTLSLQNGELSSYEKRTMDTFYKGWKMIAWMPLPKPYKGGDTK